MKYSTEWRMQNLISLISSLRWKWIIRSNIVILFPIRVGTFSSNVCALNYFLMKIFGNELKSTIPPVNEISSFYVFPSLIIQKGYLLWLVVCVKTRKILRVQLEITRKSNEFRTWRHYNGKLVIYVFGFWFHKGGKLTAAPARVSILIRTYFIS